MDDHDLSELRFRQRRMPARGDGIALQWWHVIVAAAVVLASIMMLIEFKARREAAAVQRVLVGTPEEQAAWQAELKAQEREAQLAIKAMQASAQDQQIRQIQEMRQRMRRAALGPGERCIEGKRFRRVSNGWIQNGSC